jgi:hypothetical protein
VGRGPFAKVHRSLWDGTLGPQWPGWSLFVYMLANCDAEGVIDVTPESIAARSGMPLDEVLRGIAILEAPDARSRTPDEEGRRIVRLDEHRDWGWLIVNLAQFRSGGEDPRSATLRQRRHRATVTGDDARSRPVTAGHALAREAEAEAEVDAERTNQPTAAAARRLGGIDAQGAARLSGEHPEFARWYAAYPLHKARRAAARAYAAAIRRGATPEQLRAGALSYARECASADRPADKVKHPATWLNADCWLDGQPAGGSAPYGEPGPPTGAPGAAPPPRPMFTPDEERPPTDEEQAEVAEMVAGLMSKLGGGNQ